MVKTGSTTGVQAPGTAAGVTRRAAGADETRVAGRSYWDRYSADYRDEHGEFLGDARFVWCPEDLDEADARLLGDVTDKDVLEVGAGGAQCSRWLLTQGARPVALDLSGEQLRWSQDIDERTGSRVPVVQADAMALPFADASFDLACSAYGAVPFVADPAAVMREVARVLRPGGRWVFSVTHPIRWAFPDDPGRGGLTVEGSYFDRKAYVEHDDAGRATYVEHHRTLGDRVREIVEAGLVLEDVIEPEWPKAHKRTWGPWSPLRGKKIPGTAIFVCSKPGGSGRERPTT
jgi:SAM-dependent methyltransferase